MIGRRELIALLGGAATWPLGARAQQGEPIRRIAILTAKAATDPAIKGHLAVLAKGLNSFGWSEGRNLRTENSHGRWRRSPAQHLRGRAGEPQSRPCRLTWHVGNPDPAAANPHDPNRVH